jgi:integrase
LDWQAHWTPKGFRPIRQKGSGERIVPCDREILGERGIGLVFAELGATPAGIAQKLTAAWRYAVKAATVPHYRFHDLRHSFGTRLRREGRTFSDIAAIMGITEAMAHVYAKEDREQIQCGAFKPVTIRSLSELASRA